MPLRDHFRGPGNDKHTWDEVHGGWPMMIVRDLFDILPAGYSAAPNVHLGAMFEIGVSGFEDEARVTDTPTSSAEGGVATLAAPQPTATVEADLSAADEYEVRVYDAARGRQLVAAIELVSPSNKDRPESREAFVAKVAALLQRDVCVSVVDVVTIRQANLYAELLATVGSRVPSPAGDLASLYAVTIRPRKRARQLALLDVWFYPLALGQPLPTLPIWLTPDLHVLLSLETSYEETCRLLRIA